MTVTSFDDGEMNDIASVIVEQLQAVGINAVHDIVQIPDFIPGPDRRWFRHLRLFHLRSSGLVVEDGQLQYAASAGGSGR